mmetsp:Transcript_33168/g.73979  ORF Transcript_33168/g.73979 Transcript_33168/m.73979 type:complete len:103 (-) Transcript_33168:8-316(-)
MPRWKPKRGCPSAGLGLVAVCETSRSEASAVCRLAEGSPAPADSQAPCCCEWRTKPRCNPNTLPLASAEATVASTLMKNRNTATRAAKDLIVADIDLGESAA